MKTAGGLGYAVLSKELIEKVTSINIPLLKATTKSLSRFGSLLNSKDEVFSEFKNEIWPKSTGWRPISEGTGNEAAIASGNFIHYWK